MNNENNQGRDALARILFRNRSEVSRHDIGFGFEGSPNFVAAGSDSIVITDRQTVLHLYNYPCFQLTKGQRQLSVGDLEFYQQTTSRACEYLRQQPRELLLDGSSVRIGAVPIDHVGYSRYLKTPFTAVKYIDGPNIERVYFSGDEGWKRAKVIQSRLYDMARELNYALGISGINIAMVNAKLNTDGLIITDLCSSVRGFCDVNLH